MTCVTCPLLLQKQKSFVAPEVVGDSKNPVLFLGDIPSVADVKSGRPFSDGLIKKAIRVVSKSSPRDYVMDNIIRCKSTTSVDAACKSCSNKTEKLIRDYKPSVIVAVGTKVDNFLSTKTGGLVEPSDYYNYSYLSRYRFEDGSYHYYWKVLVPHPTFMLKKGLDATAFQLPSKSGKYVAPAAEYVARISEAFTHEDHSFVYSGFANDPTSNIYLLSLEEFKNIVDNLPKVVAIDFEFEGRVYDGGYITYLSVSFGEQTFVGRLKDQYDEWLSVLKSVVTNRKLIVHSMAAELEWLLHYFGVSFYDIEDTLVMNFVLNNRTDTTLGLDSTTQKYLGVDVKQITKVKAVDIMNYPLKTAALYNGLDSKASYYTYVIMLRELKRRGLHEAYKKKRDDQFLGVVMQHRGLRVSHKDAARLHSKEAARESALRESLIKHPIVKFFHDATGKIFLPTSPQDVSLLLELVLPEDIKDYLYSIQKDEYKDTPDGKRVKVEKKISSGALILETLMSIYSNLGDEKSKKIHEFVSILYEYRTSRKLLSDFYTPIAEGTFVSKDKLLHTFYSTTGTVTGRFNSRRPNILNLPKGDVRSLIIPEEGKMFWVYDLGQIEARLIAAVSNDPVLLLFMREGRDIHAEWAGKFLKIDYFRDRLVSIIETNEESKVFKEARRIAKEFVFANFYGASPESLAVRYQIALPTMRSMSEMVFNTYRGVKALQNKWFDEVATTGTLVAPTGFILRNLKTKNRIVNLPIQHFGVSVINHAGYRLLSTTDIDLQVVMQTHDELLMKVDQETPEDAVIQCMKGSIFNIDSYPEKWQRYLRRVPLTIEVKKGYSFGTLKPVGIYTSEYTCEDTP